MEKLENGRYVGERALFALANTELLNCLFEDGESPLKESRNLKIEKCTFRWKYPIWYSNDVIVNDSTLEETARSGIWYTNNIVMNNCLIEAPKTFRRASKIVLNGCKLPNASETMWTCKEITLNDVYVKGDYFAKDSSNVEANNLEIDGNYCFDGAKNIKIRNSILKSKDSFWNSENIEVRDSTIIGEYLGWNSKNLTFINCKIISHQGFCYIDGLKMVNSTLEDSDLVFEFCSNLDVELTNVVKSIKNPYSGVIKVKGVKELTMDEKFIDPSKTKIIKL